MIMKRTSLLILLLGAIILLLAANASAQKIDSYQCRKHTGLSPDNGAAFIDKMTYDDRSNLMFMLTNDRERLYIYLIVADRATIQKIKMYGLTTWFNMEGKTKKTQGIEFPVPGGQQEMMMHHRDQPGEAQEGQKSLMKESLENMNREMILVGFDGKESRDTLLLSADTAFSGNMSFPGKEKLLISMYLPLEKLGLSFGSEKAFSVGFESGYMDLNKQGMGVPAGGGDRQMGGPPGGGYHGGHNESDAFAGGENNQPNINQLAKPNRLWIKNVVLSPR